VFIKPCLHQGCLASRKVRGEGFEPSLPASKADGLPLADPRALSVQLESKSALRELDPPVRFGRPVPLPLGQGHVVFSFRAAVAGIEPASERLTAACPYQHEHHRNCVRFHIDDERVGVVGFEPTISCFRSTRISKLSHTPITGRRRLLPQRSPPAIKSTRRESNPHVRPGEAAGRRYITGALRSNRLSKSKRAQGEIRTHVAALRVRCPRR
jgi:hypothetical protein